jgi:GAF domain-containing protein
MLTTPLSDALGALSRFLVADASIGDTLLRMAEITVDAVPPADFVGLSLLDERGRPTTAVFTDPGSPEIDATQYRTGRGPCLDAWRKARVVRVDDTAEAGGDYAEFKTAAAGHGIGSTLSMPLVAADKGIGAMNLYASAKDAFSDDDEKVGGELATVCSAVLANAVAYWDAYELSQHLTAAMQSRAVIEQAKGMLMAGRSGLNAEQAFEMLVKASQRENLKLRDIALRLVEHKPPPESAP